MEDSAREILERYFGKRVQRVGRSNIAKMADFKINGVFWELKSPRGDSKRTIQNNLRKADNQSGNVIIDLRRSNFRTSEEAIRRIKFELARATKIKRLIVITKIGKVIVIK